MKLNNASYDFFKWTVLIAIPAVSALYFGLAQIWNFPYGEEVVGTLSLVAVFLGALVGISHVNYDPDDDLAENADGDLVVGEGDSGSKLYSLELGDNLENLDSKKVVTFKVVSNQP